MASRKSRKNTRRNRKTCLRRRRSTRKTMYGGEDPPLPECDDFTQEQCPKKKKGENHDMSASVRGQAQAIYACSKCGAKCKNVG